MSVGGEDFREGITTIISMKVPEPQFEGQTKTKLGNSEIEGVVSSNFGEFLKTFMEENPSVAKIMVKKGIQAAEAREAARAAREKGSSKIGPRRWRSARQAKRLFVE